MTLLERVNIFCCLGTTIKQAVANGAEQFGLVSAVGADPRSRVFYSRAKGEAEVAVRGFPFRAVYLLRPSLLLGKRREFRLGERIAAPSTPGQLRQRW